jgi:primosomal protein N' (replication factor Y)
MNIWSLATCIIVPEVVQTASEREYVEVVIDSAVRELDRPFTYTVPPDMRSSVEIGSQVMVPFTNRPALGFVVGFPSEPGASRLKGIDAVLDEPPLFDFDTQRLCRWIASRYLCSLSQAFRLVLPPGRSRKVKQYISLTLTRDEALDISGGKPLLTEMVEVLCAAGGEVEITDIKKHLGGDVTSAVRALEEAGAVARRYALTEPAARPRSRLMVRLSGDIEELPGLDGLPRRQGELMERLIESGGAAFQSALLKAAGASASSLKSLEKKGLVRIAPEEALRRPWLGGAPATEPPVPNQAQAEAIERVISAVDEGLHSVFLLEGITGSGKTEVYLRVIERVLATGRGAITLVPEISLTPQALERFESRFPGRVAVLHSRLSPGERYDQWRGVREGRYPLVVGARSALFAPLDRLGLIVIDEEHEPSYKSDTAPRYHAREVAETLARMSGATLILGSATPSFETLEKARAGAYEHLVLPSRIDDRPLPDVEVVDMREVGGAGQVPLISPPLLDALSRAVEAGDQAILFLNRRGFANYMQCHSCGEILGCDSCEVSYCHHTRGDMLLCHHCGARRNVPERCPICGRGPLKSFGAGTQRVEDELARHLPGVTFVRMDADTTTGKDSHRRLLNTFTRGDAQVLIGTQMIAKGLDVPGVTLVGVINADTALAIPDFRASERTYQLLTQVSGRAGRGLRPGRVIVQTFNPAHPAIRAVTGIDSDFVDTELASRLHARYPPYVDLVNLTVTSPDAASASRAAARMRGVLDTDLYEKNAAILGPAPAPLSRLRGRYRWHILIKTVDLDTVSPTIRNSVARFYDNERARPAGKDVRVTLDVNPTSLL